MLLSRGATTRASRRRTPAGTVRSGDVEQVADIAAGLLDGGPHGGPVRRAEPAAFAPAQLSLVAFRECGDAMRADDPGGAQQGMQQVAGGEARHGIVADLGVEPALDLPGLAHEQAQEFGLEPLVAETLAGEMDEIDRAVALMADRGGRFRGKQGGGSHTRTPEGVSTRGPVLGPRIAPSRARGMGPDR